MSYATNSARPRGRRSGQSGSREAILEAAREAFAREAYAGASMRGIARAANVDVALISHFFGSKAGLFVAAVEWPFEPEAGVAWILEGGRRDVGRRLVEFFLGHWRVPEKRGVILALFQAAISDAKAATLLREFLNNEVFVPLLVELKADQIEMRAGLLASQLQGLAFTRYVLHQLPPEEAIDAAVVAAVAPTLQRYATGKL